MEATRCPLAWAGLLTMADRPFVLEQITSRGLHKCMGERCQWWWKCREPGKEEDDGS